MATPRALSRDDLLHQAQSIIASPQRYTQESEARVRSLLKLAELVAGDGKRKAVPPEFRRFLATGELRDMQTGTGAYPGGSGVPVPVEFEAMVFQSMRAVDDLWDAALVSFFETDHGTPWSAPCVDDSQDESEPIGEGGLSDQQDFAIGQLSLPKTTTYRSKGVLVSQELLQDSAIDIPAFLATTFGIRFDRRIGRTVLVPALVAAAPVVRTANGATAANQAPGDGTDSVSSADLTYALGQLDESYAHESAWVMTRATLAAIYGLRDSVGALVFKEHKLDDAGRPLLLGRPVALCPSMQGLGTGNVPVLLGALKRLAIRSVRHGLSMIRSEERYAEQALVWFEAYLRLNAGIAFYAADPSTPAPIVAIQNS